MGSITSKVRDEQEREDAVMKRHEAFQAASRTIEKAYFTPRSTFILATSETDNDHISVQAYASEAELLSMALGIISNILREDPEYKKQVFEELGIIGTDLLSDKLLKHDVLRSMEEVSDALHLFEVHSRDTQGAKQARRKLETVLDLLDNAKEVLNSRS